jgi:hypothetical protein
MAKERREDHPQILITIQQIKDELDNMKGDLHECTEDLKRIKKILNGNGEMGLVASVIALELSVNRMEKNNTKWSDRIWDKVMYIGASVLMLLLGIWLGTR